MSKILIPVLIGVTASASIIILSLINRKKLSGFIGRLKSKNFIGLVNLADLVNLFKKAPVSQKTNPELPVEKSPELDLSILNCRVKLSQYRDGGCVLDAFEVEICGSIHTPREVPSATLKISISDTTDSKSDKYPVNALVKQWQVPESNVFCYGARLGRLPHQITTMPDWTSIALLRLDWLELPRKGKRELKFEVSIFSDDVGERLAGANCHYDYDNQDFGYLDMKENNKRSKTLAVALAFAVSAVDGNIKDCEVELIKDWTRDNIGLSGTSKKDRRKLDRAFRETIAFFRCGKKLNNHDICQEIVEIASIEDRCKIVNLFLHVAHANGSITERKLNLLRDFADWLEIDIEIFREMIQKALPIEMYEVKDIEMILGVTFGMNKEKARRRLNKEYSKWSARVTNTDPEIQSQADQMLKLIAEARSRYIG
ncbi:MAG: TerB family tellurite resistance protein [Sedimentisphaerales bacterium]|nr:TerB family tellurite resistance protein [Sedimentisphaerales bacterium]